MLPALDISLTTLSGGHRQPPAPLGGLLNLLDLIGIVMLPCLLLMAGAAISLLTIRRGEGGSTQLEIAQACHVVHGWAQ